MIKASSKQCLHDLGIDLISIVHLLFIPKWLVTYKLNYGKLSADKTRVVNADADIDVGIDVIVNIDGVVSDDGNDVVVGSDVVDDNGVVVDSDGDVVSDDDSDVINDEVFL